MIVNLPTLIPIPAQQVRTNLPAAVALILGRQLTQKLTKKDKISVTKIMTNLNTICKLNLKQVKQLIKQEPEYQQALADIYFDKKINNYILVTQHQKPTLIPPPPLIQQDPITHPHLVLDLQYRIQFTVSNIAQKNVMKPVVLLIFTLKNGSKKALYFNLEQFALLRQKISHCMRQIYNVEIRAL